VHGIICRALLLLAVRGWTPTARPVLIVVSAIFAMNLNMFYGISEDVGYAIPRSLTLIDLSVVVSAVNCPRSFGTPPCSAARPA